jgi:hypothetical protein
MARKLLMTWVAFGRRWTKKYRGQMYAVSCKQLGCPETKDASAAAANEWWEKKQRELDEAPEEVTEEDRRINAFKVWSMIQDWGSSTRRAGRGWWTRWWGRGSTRRSRPRPRRSSSRR